MRRCASVPPVIRTRSSSVAHAARASAATRSKSTVGTSAARFARAPSSETSDTPTASSNVGGTTSAAPTSVPLAVVAADGGLPVDHTWCALHAVFARATK